MLTAEQLQAHWAMVGGSSAPSVVGVDPYRSRYQLARQYLFPEERPDLSDNEAVYWGNQLEEAIAKAAAERQGWRIKRTSKPYRRGWLGGFPDRLIVGAKEGLEIKNRGHFKLQDYRDGPLMSEIVQCSAYLAVTGFRRWWLAALVGGQKLLIFPIERDERLISDLIEACDAFGHQVILNRELPPPVTESDLTLAYPHHAPGKQVTADRDTLEAIADLHGRRACRTKLDEEVDALETRIKAVIGDAEKLVTPEGVTLATWKTQTSRRIDSDRLKRESPDLYDFFAIAHESRVFRLVKEKK